MVAGEALTQLLCPSLEGLEVDELRVEAGEVIIELSMTRSVAVCPICQVSATRIHSRYERQVADLAWAALSARLRLQVRRFFCDNQACKRQIFAERLDPVIAAYARRTQRLNEHLYAVAYALGGEAGVEIIDRFGISLSADTLVRLVRCRGEATTPPPRVLGVDDWAKRKGQSYGTILVDLERHAVVDLLPDRSAATFAAWLRQHPGVEIISRDRASAYAEGARAAAPDAIQVADRWHLLKNLREALQRLLDPYSTDFPEMVPSSAAIGADPEKLAPPLVGLPSGPPEEPIKESTPLATLPDGCSPTPDTMAGSPALIAPDAATSEAGRSEREVLFNQVKSLQSQGLSQRAIAKQLDLHRATVRRYTQHASYPEPARGTQSISCVEPYLPYLQGRWNAGVQNRQQLWQELQHRGFDGSYSSVRRATAGWLATTSSQRGPARPASSKPAGRRRRLSARQAAWLLVRRPSDLTTEDEACRTQLCDRCPVAAAAYPLAQAFIAMIRERHVEALDQWLLDARASGLEVLKNFATTLQRDYDAVKAALSLAWSNGQTEGQVHRLKLIKRMMYGRANFDLLRRRVLAPT